MNNEELEKAHIEFAKFVWDSTRPSRMDHAANVIQAVFFVLFFIVLMFLIFYYD